MSAVIEINLVPGADRRRSGGGRKASLGLKLPAIPSIGGESKVPLYAAGGVLLLLAAIYALWSVSARRAELQALVDAEVRDSTRFASTIELVNTLQARQDTIQLKIGIIREVDQRRYVWPHLLDEISKAVPAYTWLSGISAMPPADSLDTAPGIAIQGNAGSTQALTRFMKNLESSGFIRDVTLVTSEQTEMEGRSVHKFSLEARYETPDPGLIEMLPVIVINAEE
ncbi:MAG TPA: PilN domain-containing protein [Longimicrobiaceae bacterium]